MKTPNSLETFEYGAWRGIVMGEGNFKKYLHRKSDYKIAGRVFVAHILTGGDDSEKAPPSIFKEFYLHADKNWGKRKLEKAYSDRATHAVEDAMKLIDIFQALVEKEGMEKAVEYARAKSVSMNVREEPV